MAGRGRASKSIVQVGAFATRTQAEVAQSALTAAGIPSALETDDAGGVLLTLDQRGTARLLVEESRAAEAAAILAG